MRGLRGVLLTFLSLLLLTGGTVAAAENILPADLSELDPAAAAMLEPAAEDLGLFSGLSALCRQAMEEAINSFASAGKSGGAVLLGVLLLSAVSHLGGDSAGRVERCALFVGVMWIVTAAAGDLDAFLGLGKRTMGEITLLSKTLLPAMCSALAAGGSVVSASVRQVLTVFFSDLLVKAIETLLMPLLQVYLASAAAAAAFATEEISLESANWKSVQVMPFFSSSSLTTLT